jgi:hypothetical protein
VRAPILFPDGVVVSCDDCCQTDAVGYFDDTGESKEQAEYWLRVRDGVTERRAIPTSLAGLRKAAVKWKSRIIGVSRIDHTPLCQRCADRRQEQHAEMRAEYVRGAS